MARKKVVIAEPIVEEYAVEEVIDDPGDIEVAETVEDAVSRDRTVIIEGKVGECLEGGINGRMFKLPKGVELIVSPEMYSVIETYLRKGD